MKKTKTRILVTGGAGFIGAHLTEKLIKNGHQVLVVDTLMKQGGIPFINKKSKFIKGDITNKKIINKIKKWRPQIIFHLAAQSATEPAYNDPKNDILTNSLGTFMICNLAKELKIKFLIYTSSQSVYGNNQKKIISEKTKISPESLYGVSKYSGEMFIDQILRSSKVKTIIFRIFNTYGPGENLHNFQKGMVSIYSSYIWKKKPILVKGSLKRFRDFTYVSDCAEILSKSISVKLKKRNEIFNLSTGENYTVKSLLKKILYASGQRNDYPIKVLRNTQGDSFGFHASIKKLKKYFKYRPKYNLDRGLKEYFKWISRIPNVKNLNKYHPLKYEKKRIY